MEVSVIASGSNGNCCLVQKKDVSILIDAGKSGREIEHRLDRLGKSIENIDAIVLTHSHQDHVTGAGVLSRRYGIPIYMTKDVYNHVVGRIGDVDMKFFPINKQFKIKELPIKPIRTSHSVSSCGFVIDKFGLFTDTGVVTQEMEDALPKLRCVLIESNHDIDMLINGPYPTYLKKWILSDEGHLSNVVASSLIESRGKDLSLALLAHLSGNNNTPELAKRTFEILVNRDIEYAVCSRERETGNFII
ncbi:MBL fold metallo-hydrolase [Candidatus Woesearchaeota archaeon]|nr:MBL fold metallo-hydrolase [Candidatus Woesearchaeota archaeon]